MMIMLMILGNRHDDGHDVDDGGCCFDRFVTLLHVLLLQTSGPSGSACC